MCRQKIVDGGGRRRLFFVDKFFTYLGQHWVLQPYDDADDDDDDDDDDEDDDDDDTNHVQEGAPWYPCSGRGTRTKTS